MTYYGDDGDMGDRMEADQLMAALEERARIESKKRRTRAHLERARDHARDTGTALTLWLKRAKRGVDWTETTIGDDAHPDLYAIVQPNGEWRGPKADKAREALA